MCLGVDRARININSTSSYVESGDCKYRVNYTRAIITLQRLFY